MSIQLTVFDDARGMTLQELFSTEELQQKFSLERITKSAAVFDKTKLSWMNGQYLRALPDEEVMSPFVVCQQAAPRDLPLKLT